MIHQDLQLHNVVELEPAEGGGVYLRRFPSRIREAISPLGRMVSQESAGVEIRFVTEARSFRVGLGSLPSVLAPYELHNQDVMIFRGAFFHSRHQLVPGRVNAINVVNIGGVEPFDTITDSAARACGFSPQVWRILLGRYPAILHGVDTYGYPRRPPHADELPSRRWIAYGSSITNGASPTVHHNSYIYTAARIAGLDVCNQGLSGACLCEPEIADYLAARDDWQVMTLELGVNMRGGFTAEQFRDRAQSLVRRISTAHPDRLIVLITIFSNAASPGNSCTPDAQVTARQEDFDAILRELAGQRGTGNVRLIEGKELLADAGALCIDLIHPSDYGHAQIGHTLGPRLRDLLASPL